MTFRPVMDVVTNTILYLDSFLMCNDEELGLLAPGMYFYAAENSERIETLNFIAIDLVAEALDKVKIEYNLDPKFSLLLSSRFLESDDKFKELYAKLASMELPHGRIILTFSAVTVLRVGHTANTYLKALRKKGFQIALTDFTVDTAEFSLLCDYHFDYLRIDADYVESASSYARKNTAMQMLRDYAYKENVLLVANGVNTPNKVEAMRNNGIYAQSGAAIARGNSKIEQIYGVARVDDASDKYNAPIEDSEGRLYTDTKDNKGAVAIADEYAEDYVRETEYDQYEEATLDEDVMDVEGGDEDTRISKSFTARLIQASEDVQMFYNAIKNTAHSYRDVISKVGWSYDKIITGKKTLIKIGIRGNRALVVYFALPVAEYATEEPALEDVSGDKRHVKTPLRIKIRDEFDLKKAMLLVTKLMERRGVPFSHLEQQDYRLPYESTDRLLERGLIKQLEQSKPTSPQATQEKIPPLRDTQVKLVTTNADISSNDDLNKLARDFAACLGHDADDDATEVVVCYVKKGGKK